MFLRETNMNTWTIQIAAKLTVSNKEINEMIGFPYVNTKSPVSDKNTKTEEWINYIYILALFSFVSHDKDLI